MRKRKILAAAVLLLALVGVGFAQRLRVPREAFPFREDEDQPMPADAGEKTEFAFARLQYPNWRSNDRMWSMRGAWSIDYPKADRQFVQGVRRLTRLHVRSVEQVVNLDSDDIMNFPWAYVVEAGHWDLKDSQVVKLREYLLKGGFAIFDDFRMQEWSYFEEAMRKVLPDAKFIDLTPAHPIYHTYFDIDDFEIVKQYYDPGRPIFRAVFEDNDPKKRMLCMINYNTDISEFWEWSPSGFKPISESNEAYQIGVNWIIYGMTR